MSQYRRERQPDGRLDNSTDHGRGCSREGGKRIHVPHGLLKYFNTEKDICKTPDPAQHHRPSPTDWPAPLGIIRCRPCHNNSGAAHRSPAGLNHSATQSQLQPPSPGRMGLGVTALSALADGSVLHAVAISEGAGH
jgi:hypothetical protein